MPLGCRAPTGPPPVELRPCFLPCRLSPMAASAPSVLVVRRERRQIQAFRERLAPDRDPALAITLIEIPAGTFLMGSPEGEEGQIGRAHV